MTVVPIIDIGSPISSIRVRISQYEEGIKITNIEWNLKYGEQLAANQRLPTGALAAFERKWSHRTNNAREVLRLTMTCVMSPECIILTVTWSWSDASCHHMTHFIIVLSWPRILARRHRDIVAEASDSFIEAIRGQIFIKVNHKSRTIFCSLFFYKGS